MSTTQSNRSGTSQQQQQQPSRRTPQPPPVVSPVAGISGLRSNNRTSLGNRPTSMALAAAKLPPHLRDHVWDERDGYVAAEQTNLQNKARAEEAARSGETYYIPRIPHRRTATLRPVQEGPPPPFEHVPYEDPQKWEKLHHFKRFATRPEMIHDSVWACTGHAETGLPEVLRKLLPEHSPLRRGTGNTRNAIHEQLRADGAMPPPLPKYRKLWSFQRRELALSKRLTVPPRPPQSLEDKYPDGFQVISNPATTTTASLSRPTSARPARDSCVAGCCPECGTNLKPWAASATTTRPMSAHQQHSHHRDETSAPIVSLPRSTIVKKVARIESAAQRANSQMLRAASATAVRKW